MTQAGWYPDPSNPAGYRWWNGSTWSSETQQGGEPTATLELWGSAEVDRSVVAARAAGEQVLVQVGELACSQNWLMTPNGTVPLRSVQFLVRENVVVQKRIPPYAIVLAIIFFLACLLGLFFLLLSEETYSGSIEVTATAPDGFTFHTSIPTRDARTVEEVRSRVTFARSLVAQLG